MDCPRKNQLKLVRKIPLQQFSVLFTNVFEATLFKSFQSDY
ncbi:Protein of unknown function [Bacillus wiedmannii]|nr:Protein of unknown function [Bacillus wiedmannii]